MGGMISENIKIDDSGDVIELFGIRYAGEVFRRLYLATPHMSFEVIEVKDGVITLKDIPVEGLG